MIIMSPKRTQVFPIQKNFPKVTVGAVLVTFILGISIPKSHCHIASLLANGQKKVVIGNNIIFSDFGAADGKPPHLQHIRVSRGPTVPSNEDYPDLAPHMSYFKSPSFQHKYLYRLSQFHNNGGSNGGRGTYALTNHFGGDFSDGNNGKTTTTQKNDASLERESPTFTPYIGARVLSNIPKFFEHLRENLEALQQEDDYSSSLEGDIGQPDRRTDPSGEIGFDNDARENSQESNLKFRWQPAASGLNHHFRNFVESSDNSDKDNFMRRANNFNPGWLYTNLGLGRRR